MSSVPHAVARTWVLALGFVVFWLGAVLVSWVLCPLLALTVRDPLRRRRRLQAFLRATFRTLHAAFRASGMLEITVDPVVLPRPSVVVANHPTLLDITAILAHLPDACCLVKSPLHRSVFIGRMLRTAGYVDAGTRGTVDEARAALEATCARLAEGFHVVIFPEGTRSPARGLGPFHRGAFDLALRTGSPLVPAFITCEPPCFGKGARIWEFPRERCRLHVAWTESVEPSELAPKSRALTRSVEASYRAALRDGELPASLFAGPQPALPEDGPRVH